VAGNVNDAWTYTGFGEAATYTASAGASTLYATDFARDAAGRITNKLEVIGAVLSSYDYTYDPDRGWLTDVSSNGVAVSRYTYDDNGNRLTRVTPGDTVTGVYDDQDRLLSLTGGGPVLPTTFTYTANGELLAKTTGTSTTSYSYDVRGSLRDVTLADGTRISYVIDATGRRIGRKVNGGFTQQWLYQDSLKPIAELDGAGNVVSRFIYAGKANVPEYMVRGGVAYRLITDHLGSVRLVVNASDGSIAQQMDYDEFGQVLLDTNPGFQPFGYPYLAVPEPSEQGILVYIKRSLHSVLHRPATVRILARRRRFQLRDVLLQPAIGIYGL
jgi:YD repeat-containing protein